MECCGTSCLQNTLVWNSTSHSTEPFVSISISIFFKSRNRPCFWPFGHHRFQNFRCFVWFLAFSPKKKSVDCHRRRSVVADRCHWSPLVAIVYYVGPCLLLTGHGKTLGSCLHFWVFSLKSIAIGRHWSPLFITLVRVYF